MKKAAHSLLSLCLLLSPTSSYAQNAAPELFGVQEVVIDYAHFTDPKAADACGLSREEVASTLAKALNGTGVPAVSAAEARPPSLGIARIELVPQIAVHAGDNLDCASWIGLSAENRANLVISPISTMRSVTVVYWRQQMTVASNQSGHAGLVEDVLQKMAAQFAQQYRLDQPPDLPK